MNHRRLAPVAILLTGAYVLCYVAVIRAQDDGDVAWWYLGFLALAVLALAVATSGYRPLASLGVATVVLSLGTLVGLLSVGLLLLPAALVSGIALALALRSSTGPIPAGVRHGQTLS